MSDREWLDAATELKIRQPERLWGITLESIYLFLCDRFDESSHHLKFHNQVETLRTNNEKTSTTVTDFHQGLARYLGLIDDEGEPTNFGIIVYSSEKPETLIQALTIREFPNLRQAVQDFTRIEVDHIKRAEFQSYFPDNSQAQRLLAGSLGFVDIYPDSVDINNEAAQRFFGQETDQDISNADWVLFARSSKGITNITDDELLCEIYSEISDSGEEWVNPESVDLKKTLAHAPSIEPKPYPMTAVRQAVKQLDHKYTEEAETVKQLLTEFNIPSTDSPDNPEMPAVDGYSENDITRLLDLLTAVNGSSGPLRLHPQFLLAEYDCDLYDLFQLFENLEVVGIEASITTEDLIKVDSAPECNFKTGSAHDYFDQLLDYHRELETRVGDLRQFKQTSTKDVATKKIKVFEGLDQSLISPTYFTYTLLNPEKMGEEVMDQYIGDSDGLQLEKLKLEDWPTQKPDNIKPYQEMLDKLFKKGLEDTLGQEVVRIMTPYDDDTFREYSSALRELAREGYEIRLLTRFTRNKYLWDRLKENLLEPLGEHRTNVSIRTYSRYKTHQYISRGEDADHLKEFGIHGKLQTIGDPDDGAVLLGSANFMENSFDWNPECGVYTENPVLLESAIKYFDFVWELAEADPVSFDQMREVPDREFYPSYYRR